MKNKKVVLLLFGLFLVLLFYLLMKFFLFEDMQKKVSLVQKYRLQKQIYEYGLENRKHLENELQQYHYIKKFVQNRVDAKRLRELLNQFMSLREIVMVSQKSDEHIVIKVYKVQAIINTPKDFYEFLEFINKSGYPLLIKPPIGFEKVGKMIEVSFFLKQYTLKF